MSMNTCEPEALGGIGTGNSKSRNSFEIFSLTFPFFESSFLTLLQMTTVAVDEMKTQWDDILKDLRKLCKAQSEQLKKASEDVHKWQSAAAARLDRPRGGRGTLGFSALHDLC